MKIIHILNHVKQVGNGIVNVAVDLACLQSQLGHQVAVVSAGGDYESLLARYNVSHYQLNQKRNPINLIKALKQYREIALEFQPDIVHCHMMTGMILAWLVRSKYRLVSTVHNEFQRSAVFMGLADRVIAVSEAVAESMNKRGINKQKLVVVLNGTLGSPRNKKIQDYTPLSLQRKSITTVAGLYERKGIGELIEAFRLIADDFPDVNLYIVGEGPDRSLFVTQAEKTNLSDRIHFEGFQTSPQSYLLSSDIFVLASHRDPSPLVIPEAREAGCAIIASNVDGIPELLEQGKAGILVPAKDPHSLASALKRLLSDPDLRQYYQQQGRNNLESLTVNRVVTETLALYESMLIGNYV